MPIPGRPDPDSIGPAPLLPLPRGPSNSAGTYLPGRSNEDGADWLVAGWLVADLALVDLFLGFVAFAAEGAGSLKDGGGGIVGKEGAFCAAAQVAVSTRPTAAPDMVMRSMRIVSKTQITPRASIASATRTKLAMFAPRT